MYTSPSGGQELAPAQGLGGQQGQVIPFHSGRQMTEMGQGTEGP